MVWIMAFLQTDRGSITGLKRTDRSPGHQPADGVAHLTRDLQALIRYWRATLQRWSMGRQARAWRTTTERARRRRALARLSDRELRDIGITRYDIEFLLRKSRWR
jgi:uncharacterized protein YjiS (DUF1127 family)